MPPPGELASSTSCLPPTGSGAPCSTPLKKMLRPTLVVRGATLSLTSAFTLSVSVRVATGCASPMWAR